MTSKTNIQDKLPGFVKEMWTNAVDAIYKTEDEVKTFINKMVERGKMTPEEGKKIITELKGKFNDNRKKIEKRANESLEKAMHRINLPTKTEVESLGKRIATLTKKVNKLKKEVAA